MNPSLRYGSHLGTQCSNSSSSSHVGHIETSGERMLTSAMMKPSARMVRVFAGWLIPSQTKVSISAVILANLPERSFATRSAASWSGVAGVVTGLVLMTFVMGESCLKGHKIEVKKVLRLCCKVVHSYCKVVHRLGTKLWINKVNLK